MRVLHHTTYSDTQTFVRVKELGRLMTVAHTQPAISVVGDAPNLPAQNPSSPG